MIIFFETPHLIVQVPTLEDYALLHELEIDKDVMHYIGDGSISSPARTRAKLEKDINHFAKHHFGTGLVFEKKTNAFVGQGGLTFLEYDDTQANIELDVVLHKAFWRKGYATELVKEVVAWGFNNLPVTKLVAVVDLHNVNSQKLVVKSGLSFIKEAWHYNKPVKLYEIVN